MHLPAKDCALLNECVTAVPLFPPTSSLHIECARKIGLAAASFSVLILFSTSIYARFVANYTRRFGVRACVCVLREEATI